MFWAHMSCTAGANIEPTILPSGNLAASIDIASGTEKWGLFFNFFLDAKSERTKNLETMRQNNAVLRIAGLSGPKPAPARDR